jgi:hypothetical protein
MRIFILTIMGFLLTLFIGGCGDSSNGNTDTNAAHAYVPLDESERNPTVPLVTEADLQ